MKKILYIGNVGRGSYGDDVAYAMFREYILKNYRSEISVKLLSMDPKNNYVVGHTDGYDFFLIGGGTCISNLYRPYADRIAMGLKDLGKRYGFFGTGVFFESQRNQEGMKCVAGREEMKRTKRFIENAEFISVRDEQSARFMRAMTERKDIGICGDPGLRVTPRDTYGLDLDASSWHERVIGINICGLNDQDRLGAIPADDRIVRDRFSDFVMKYQSRYTFLHIPFNELDTRNDEYLSSFGVKCMPFTTPDRIAGFMSLCDYFIGHRLYADVTAAALEVPFISVAYSEPNINFLTHIKWLQIILTTELCDGDMLFEDIFPYFEDIQFRLSCQKHLKKVVLEAQSQYRLEADRLCRMVMEE